MTKWDHIDEVDGETGQLITLVLRGWDWEWPGWNWVAGMLNDEFHNNRTAAACRKKYDRYEEDMKKTHSPKEK